MEAMLTPVALPTQVGFRAHLHQVVDEIQDEDVLRVALLLLTCLAVAE